MVKKDVYSVLPQIAATALNISIKKPLPPYVIIL
jgi:hypothetical protein